MHHFNVIMTSSTPILVVGNLDTHDTHEIGGNMQNVWQWLWLMTAYGVKSKWLFHSYIQSSSVVTGKLEFRPEDQIHSLAIEADALIMEQKC